MKVRIENLIGTKQIYDGVMETFFDDEKITIELSDGSEKSFLLSKTTYFAIDDIVYQDCGWLESYFLLLKGKKMTLPELMKFYFECTGKRLCSKYTIIGDNELWSEENSFFENEEYKEEEYPYLKYDHHNETVHFF